MIKHITIKEGQSLLDVAIQEYGTAAGIFDMLRLNTRLNGVVDNVYEGEELVVDSHSPMAHHRIYRKLQTHRIATIDKEERARGIGYMQIESTYDNVFIVR